MKLLNRFFRAFRSNRDGDAQANSLTLLSLTKRSIRFIRRNNPLALTGWVVFSGSVYLLGTGFATDNAYSFLLSAVFFLLLLTVVVITRIEARRARIFDFSWESTAPLIARQQGNSQRLQNSGFRPLPFFRIHVSLNALFTAGRAHKFHFRRDISFAHKNVIHFELFLPFNGTIHASYHTSIRDIFGFARAVFGEDGQKVLSVRPAFVVDRKPPRVEAQQGEEKQNRMKASDVERYFMREYIPGDRSRDINWKASSRYSQLFTRISPVTQEKTEQLTLFFRPFNSSSQDTLESLALLDRSKSMLMFFLRSVHAIHPEYEFRVYIGNEHTELESDADIETLATEIASVHYRSYGGEPTIDVRDLSGGAYVFTTACDTGIHEFLAQFLGDPPVVYRSFAVRRADEHGVVVRLFNDIDSFFPGTVLMAKSGNARTPPTIPSDYPVTDEALEVHIG